MSHGAFEISLKKNKQEMVKNVTSLPRCRLCRARWPDWANFRLLGNFLPWAVLGKHTEESKNFGLFSTLKNYLLILTENGLCMYVGHILGDFFTNSLCHPVHTELTLLLIEKILKINTASHYLQFYRRLYTKELHSERIYDFTYIHTYIWFVHTYDLYIRKPWCQ
jgi:hypothetical protein